jgi:hypothetical protein
MYRQWSVSGEGHSVVVQAWVNWLWVKAELWVDGTLVDRNEYCYWLADSSGLAYECLAAPVRIEDRVYKIEVLITQGSFRPFCNILVDNQLLGGDVSVKLKVRDFSAWKEARSKGINPLLAKFGFRLSFAYGLMGASWSILCSLIYPFKKHLALLIAQWSLVGAFSGFLLALVLGCISFRVQEILYSAALSHRAKLSAVPQTILLTE